MIARLTFLIIALLVSKCYGLYCACVDVEPQKCYTDGCKMIDCGKRYGAYNKEKTIITCQATKLNYNGGFNWGCDLGSYMSPMQGNRGASFPNYEAGAWGPDFSEACGGHVWCY